MKAIAQDDFGSPEVLELTEVGRPEFEDDEVLVRVHAASPNPWDWHFMRGLPYIARIQGAGLRTPKNKILGSDMAGRVEVVGKDVTRFRPGDEVFGFVGHGAFAEYVAVAENVLALKPAKLSFKQAATVPLAAMTANTPVTCAPKCFAIRTANVPTPPDAPMINTLCPGSTRP